MADEAPRPVALFDPQRDVRVLERRLPHWSQAGTICFITWRTWDSMPRKVLDGWLAERAALLRQHAVDPDDPQWQETLLRVAPKTAAIVRRAIAARWHEHLDACHGACVLRRPELAKTVGESLSHADGQRYDLYDYVVMPNHVHLLASFPDDEAMLAQCESWKHFTARRINQALARKGRIWQADGFDHLVRSEEQFEYLRDYIAQNPNRARLRPREFLHYSARA
jgi:type I restriction enzyme R subunit